MDQQPRHKYPSHEPTSFRRELEKQLIREAKLVGKINSLNRQIEQAYRENKLGLAYDAANEIAKLCRDLSKSIYHTRFLQWKISVGQGEASESTRFDYSRYSGFDN